MNASLVIHYCEILKQYSRLLKLTSVTREAAEAADLNATQADGVIKNV